MDIPYEINRSLIQFKYTSINKNRYGKFFEIHRHDLYEIVCITEGSIKLILDFQTYTLEKNTIYLIKPGQIHQWSKDNFSNNYVGHIFHFSKDFLPSYDMVNKLFENNSLPIIEISSSIINNIEHLISMIKKEETTNSNVTSYLFGSILEYILKFKKSTTNLYYKDQRIYLLIDLIEQNFKKEKSALFYANHFELTTKRLNELTKKYLNKTLSSLIIDRNIVEIKRELTYSDLSIKEISEKLSFNETSYFSKFFKKYTGYSPLNFRELSQKKI